MMIRCADSREDLPDNIKTALREANVFYSDNYAKLLTCHSGRTVYLYSDDFILPAVLFRKYFFRYANFPVEYLAVGANAAASAKQFLDECVRFLKSEHHIHWIAPTSASAFFLEYPTTSIRIPFGSHVVDLRETEEELWAKVHSKHRNSIRKAEKSGVEIRFGGREFLDDYMVLDAQTWERSGKSPTDKNVYIDQVNSLGDHFLIAMAYKDNEAHGGAIFFYNTAMSYYMYGASRNQPESGSMNLLHWKTMLFMKQRGVKSYSFVGCRIDEDENSKYRDIQRFKERFGGRLAVGYMFKVITNQFFFGLFGLLARLRSRTVYQDPIDQEIHKWPELNRRAG